MPEILTASDLLTQAAEHGGPLEFARLIPALWNCAPS
jgi:hypothetical protein